MRRRRIYYDVVTGDVIKNTGETKNPLASEISIEDEILIFTELSERNRETFSCIQLEIGQYEQDFIECSSYHVNPEIKELEFSYPDPNEPEVEQPYQVSLSQQIKELKQENKLLKAQNNARSERADFIEDIIAEMATQVYQ